MMTMRCPERGAEVIEHADTLTQHEPPYRDLWVTWQYCPSCPWVTVKDWQWADEDIPDELRPDVAP